MQSQRISYTPHQLLQWETCILNEAKRQAAEAYPQQGTAQEKLAMVIVGELTERFPRSPLSNIYLNTHLLLQPILELSFAPHLYTSAADLSHKTIHVKQIGHPLFGVFFRKDTAVTFAHVASHQKADLQEEMIKVHCVADLTLGMLKLNQHRFEFIATKDERSSLIRLSLPIIRAKIMPDGKIHLPNGASLEDAQLPCADFSGGKGNIYCNAILTARCTLSEQEPTTSTAEV